MATKQRIVYGATVEWGDDGTTFTNVPEVKTLAVPSDEIEYVDATNLDSAGGYREYVAGLVDAGEITLNAGYTSDGFETAYNYQVNKTLVYFRTTLPVEEGQSTGDVFEFTALVRAQLQQNAVGELIGFDMVLRISGQPTFTKGPAA